jgi:hypothetical protein
MADAAGEMKGQSTSQPGGSWSALALAILGWCLAPIAMFVGIGEPLPGPGYERALAHKVVLARGIYGAALLSAAGAIVLGLIARAHGRRGGLFGALVGGAFLAATAAVWLVAR